MKTPDYEEKVSLDLSPGTSLEDLGDMVMQADPEKIPDSSSKPDDSVKDS